ncbi:type I-F CRISPR-associated endoribonuclease Cas6/Csy4 [Salinibius halmophilus]|uniref:type I-F CRISPR-associated endoribonuclease Cas6/Csy4 n=1 Tax=Salinibius halmophilus TaxID=1853216 RepID=UPI000E66F6CA|nr:type I-F CRISPR-associated endoribonuclease Cas6/Csy4 [Salinibius halmophilus]
MNYYIEVTVLPDAEVAEGFIWQKLFQQVHLALAANKLADNHSAVGLGFPQYQAKGGFPLGSKLRLFAPEQQQLEALNLPTWLNRLTDYLHIKSIQPVPANCDHEVFQRKRVKGQTRIEKDMHNKAKLWAEKSGQTLEQCLQVLETSKPKASSKLPFVWVESQTTKESGSQRFPLFIERLASEGKQVGIFNCYGLADVNKPASVPNF